MPLANPHVKLVPSKVGSVTRSSDASLAGKVRPVMIHPICSHKPPSGRVRIPVLVSVLVMQTMSRPRRSGRLPKTGSRKRSGRTRPASSFYSLNVLAAGAPPDAEASCYPPQQDRKHKRLPGKREQCGNRSNVKGNQKNVVSQTIGSVNVLSHLKSLMFVSRRTPYC
jgi:hypothetical protein